MQQAKDGEGDRPGAALLGAELRRERLLDIEQRITPYRRRAFAILAATLLAAGPWLGWLWLIPLALAGAAFTIADRMLPRSPRPHLWAAAGWAVSPLMIAVSVALTGAATSPAIAWFALPAVTLATRFERRGVTVGSLYIVALMLASTVMLEPAEVNDDPTVLLFSAALVAGTLMFSFAIVDSEREHRRSSIIDPLTGMLNRAALAQRLEDLAPGAETSARRDSLGLLFTDLDHFKRINDEHGHPVGDAVLRDVAYAMRNALRSFDLAFRVGGEEFLILLPGADRPGLERVAERLRLAAAECSQPGLPVTISVGGAWSAAADVDFEALSRAADAALYRAKRSGRDRVCIAPTAEADPARGEGPGSSVAEPGRPLAESSGG